MISNAPATKTELAQLMWEIFNGRTSAYAIKILNKQGKKLYIPDRDPTSGKDLEFTPEVCLRHIEGKISIGVYPLDAKDLVQWAAIDFDSKHCLEDPLTDAKKIQQLLLADLGVISWIERSQSGSGIHLWIFFEEKVPARAVRAVLSRYIQDFGKSSADKDTTFDRIFPNQDSAYGGYGNLCGLPLNGADLIKAGKTVFLKEDGEPWESQSKVLWDIYNARNKIEIFLEALHELPAETLVERVRGNVAAVPGGSKLLSPNGCNWLLDAYNRSMELAEPEWYAAICQFAQVKNGEQLAHKFSAPYPDYSFSETHKKFHHAVEENKPHTIETVQQQFGECKGGCKCKALGLKFPWELAKVPLTKLVQETERETYDARQLATNAVALVEEIASGKKIGFPWGYDPIDDATELRPGDLIIVAARRSIGKTALAIDASMRGALKSIPQYVLSLEMTAQQLGLRYLANISKIDQTLLMKARLGEEEWIKLKEAQEKMSALPLFVDDRFSNIDEMVDRIGDLVYTYGQGPIWVDYLQLVKKTGMESKKEAVDRAIIAYKQLAKVLEVPVIALAQLNRQEETYEGDDELDSWLKDSGDIEQTADVIIYIRGKRGPGSVFRKLTLHKDRHREAGINFKFTFHQSTFTFEPVSQAFQGLEDGDSDLVYEQEQQSEHELFDQVTPEN